MQRWLRAGFRSAQDSSLASAKALPRATDAPMATAGNRFLPNFIRASLRKNTAGINRITNDRQSNVGG
jgi:hypothetical protein